MLGSKKCHGTNHLTSVFFQGISLDTLQEIIHTGSWHPPLKGQSKLNIDLALFCDIKEAEVGVILKDSQGNAILAVSLLEKLVFDPKSIENLAIFWGFSCACTMGFRILSLNRAVFSLWMSYRESKNQVHSWAIFCRT